MQNRVDYSVEMQFTPPRPHAPQEQPPLHRAGTLLLGTDGRGTRPAAGEVTACLCLCGDGVEVELSLVCRPAAQGRVQLSGRARRSGDLALPGETAPSAEAQGSPTFCFELAPGETRPCTLRVRPDARALGWGAEVRLRAHNVALGGDPASSIAARAAALGPRLTGPPLSGCEAVPGGHRVRYRHADVYFSAAGGAHELRGPVRDKYAALGGPGGDLGLPLTGVRPTPDGQGRCAHFAGGSVYWHPTTGAMALRGPLRDAWSAAGGERGPLGYPTSDGTTGEGPTSGSQPWAHQVTFQNGVLLGSASGAHAPALASLSAERLRAALERALTAAASDAGWPVTAALVGVSATRPGLRRSGGRVHIFRLTGGAATGSGDFPPSGFGAELPLLFEAVPSPDTPGRTRLRARLFGAALFGAALSGTGSPDPQRQARHLRAQVTALFGQPATLFEVAETAGFLALTVLPDGALSLAFRPDVLGRLAAQAAQGQLDDLQF